MVTRRVALAGIAGVLGLAACSSKGLIFSTRKDPSSAEGGAPAIPSTPAAAGFLPGFRPRDGGVCESVRIDPMKAAPRPGLLLLVDVSTGMSEPVDMSTWWTRTAWGILDFLKLPGTGFGVGLQFFPNHSVPDACNFQYGTPDIEVAAAGDVYNSFGDSAFNVKLEGPSALAPALRGALAHMQQWAAQQSRPAVVVVLTHGGTTGCPPAVPNEIEQIAADGISADPKVPTYVIGLGAAPEVYQLAQYGGTKDPPMITSDVRSAVTLALSKIVTDLTCTFAVQQPPRSRVSSVTINVLNTPTSTPPRGSSEQCDPQMGGFYVNQGAETRISFCPASCAALGLENAHIDVNFDCATTGK